MNINSNNNNNNNNNNNKLYEKTHLFRMLKVKGTIILLRFKFTLNLFFFTFRSLCGYVSKLGAQKLFLYIFQNCKCISQVNGIFCMQQFFIFVIQQSLEVAAFIFCTPKLRNNNKILNSKIHQHMKYNKTLKNTVPEKV